MEVILDPHTQKCLMDLLANREWRLNNLYLILDADGRMIPFQAREEQREFRRDRHRRNFVPKARKLGISTEIVIENGDECIFTANLVAGIIDYKEDDAFAKLQIFRFAWENGPKHPEPGIAWLWTKIHEANPLAADNDSEMAWSNGALFRAGTSFTGRTPQRLHISEYGPIAAQQAARAADIQRGSINSVEPSGIIDIETTMEGGRAGLCYHYFKLAKEACGREQTVADYRLHFFSWLGHPSYTLNAKPTLGATIQYFDDLREKYGVNASEKQMAWWESRRRELGDEMWQQYPTVIDECDKAMVVGCIFPEMTSLRMDGRITLFSPVPGLPLVASFDLGSSDNMAGWLIQPAGRAHNLLAWCAGEGKGAAGVAGVIRQWEVAFGPIGIILLPHDAGITDKGSGKTYEEQLVECGIPKPCIRVVPRTHDVWVGIREVSKRLPNTWIHPRCDEPVKGKGKDGDLTEQPSGVARLEGYRKTMTSAGLIKSIPVKDGLCDHTADALRTYAEGDSLGMLTPGVNNNAVPDPYASLMPRRSILAGTPQRTQAQPIPRASMGTGLR